MGHGKSKRWREGSWLRQSADGFAADGNGFDHHSGELLSMTILTACFLFRAHFVNDHFLTATVSHHFEFHTGALDIGFANGGDVTVFDQKHFVEGDLGVDVGMQPVEVVITVGLHPKLLSRGLDDGVRACLWSGL